MTLWKKAAGAFKDRNSLWLANTTSRSAISNPEIERRVIRATAHNGLLIDSRSVDRVRQWLAISPVNLKPLLWAISNRVYKTRDWIVTLKSLYLIHILINTQLPCICKIGRLPFDLSGFKDGHIGLSKAWPFNDFIRAYYAFLDQKSVVVFQERASSETNPIMRELVSLQKFQGLIDLLLQIKPHPKLASVPMIRDVMDIVIVEVYDFYSRICRGIAVILMNIYSAGKTEATVALNLVLKATRQSEEVISFLELCEEIGMVRESELPVIDRIPEEGIQSLQKIVEHLVGEKQKRGTNQSPEKGIPRLASEKQERVVVEDEHQLKTIITENWEKFEEETCPGYPVLCIENRMKRMEELPDLIIL